MALQHGVDTDVVWAQTKTFPTDGDEIFTGSQNKPQRLKYLILRNFLYEVWYSELIAILFSLACLVAIAFVSRVYDGKPVPALPSGITLNAINSVLATASKSALIYSVANCISQCKWLWYRKEKIQRLGDLQIFDDASRGPLGALQLCISRTRSSFGLIGAFIVLLVTAFDPFIQQLLIYPADTVYTPSNLTWTGQARMFPGDGPATSAYPAFPFQNALWSNNSAQFARRPVCASTNCTWDRFQSLGFCTKCMDLTTTARVQNCDSRPTTFNGYSTYPVIDSGGPDGPTLNKTCELLFDSGLVIPFKLSIKFGGYGYWSIDVPVYVAGTMYSFTPATRVGDTQFLPNPNKTVLGIRNPLVVVGAATLGLKGVMVEVLHAQMCTLDFCLRKYEVEVNDGIPHVGVPQVRYGTKFLSWVYDNCWTTANPPFDPKLLIDTTWARANYPGDPSYEVYSGITDQGRQSFTFCYESASYAGGWPVVRYTLDKVVNGTRIRGLGVCDPTRYNCTGRETTPRQGIFGSDPGAWSSASVERMNDTGLATYMENLAESLTKMALDSDDNKVLGKAGTMVTFVRVQWLWLILPLILVLLGLIFLLVTRQASKKRKTPLWKASLWPLLFRGLEDEVDVHVNNTGSMQEVADEMNVRLRHEDDGRLTLGR